MNDDSLKELLNRGYRYALSLTHDTASAEDLVHDAWMRILGNGGPRHAGYLFATIRNQFIDRHRRASRFPLVALSEQPEATDPVDLQVRLEDKHQLNHVLATLAPEEREVLLLTAVEGWTLDEVAALQQRPRGTVSSLLRAVKQRLVKRLTQLGVA